MGKEVKTEGTTVRAIVAKSTKAAFFKNAKAQNSNGSEVLRNFIQAYNKQFKKGKLISKTVSLALK